MAVHDIKNIRNTIARKHTFVAAVILLVIMFLVGYIGYATIWQGSHFDYMDDYLDLEYHETIINLTALVGYEHPLVGYHRGLSEEGHIHRSHPQHHSNLEYLLMEMSHAHHFYLWVAFHVQVLALITLGLRLFYLFDKTWEYVLELSILVLLISCLAQVVGLVALVYVLYHAWCTASIFLWIGQSWLAIIELGTFLALWSLRQKLNFLRSKHHEVLPKLAPHVETLQKQDSRKSLKRAGQRLLKDRDFFWDFFTGFSSRLKDNFSKLSSNNRFKDKFE